MNDLSRRSFFAGLGASLIAAPAIVRAASLMPVKALVLPTEDEMRVILDGRVIAKGGLFRHPAVWEPLSPLDPVAAFQRARNERRNEQHRRLLTFGDS